MPADARQVNEMHFAPPREVSWRIHPKTGISLVQLQAGNRRPPLIQVGYVESDHEVFREVPVIKLLQNELGIPVTEPGTTAILPDFFKPQFREEPTADFIVLTARDKRQQRRGAQFIQSDSPELYQVTLDRTISTAASTHSGRSHA